MYHISRKPLDNPPPFPREIDKAVTQWVKHFILKNSENGTSILLSLYSDNTAGRTELEFCGRILVFCVF